MKRKEPDDRRPEFIEHLPFNIAVIDRDFNVIDANIRFQDFFGNWKGLKCYQVCKKSRKACVHCKAHEVFETGEMRVSDEAGITKNGEVCHYAVYFSPVTDEKGNVLYVVEASTNITEAARYQREYSILFERVPCFVTVLDRDFNIIRANDKFRETFGNNIGRHCFDIYKNRKTHCKDCPALITFNDGSEQIYAHSALLSSGEEGRYLVRTTPLARENGKVTHIMEIVTDITEQFRLQQQLELAQDFHTALIQNTSEGIIALNNKGSVQIFNQKAREIFNWSSHKKPGVSKIKEMLPPEFFELNEGNEEIRLNDAIAHTSDGRDISVRLEGVVLKSKNTNFGKVAFIQDIEKMKDLEKKRLEAERYSIIGQTVAGISDKVLTMLDNLNSGISVFEDGRSGNDEDKIRLGLSILKRHHDNTRLFIDELLYFTEVIPVGKKISDPKLLGEFVIDNCREYAESHGVAISLTYRDGVKNIFVDPKAIAASIKFHVINGIEAAKNREKGSVKLNIANNDKEMIFEIIDNGSGMDFISYSKIFKSMFSTKGKNGTGIGLLASRKIVEAHGGRIESESIMNSGSTFRLLIPL